MKQHEMKRVAGAMFGGKKRSVVRTENKISLLSRRNFSEYECECGILISHSERQGFYLQLLLNHRVNLFV